MSATAAAFAAARPSQQQQSTSTKNPSRSKQQPGFVKAILALYNGFCFLVWASILYKASLQLYQSNYVNGKRLTFGELYDNVGKTLEFAQTFAFLEILFIVIGWVPSQVSTALIQCAVRCLVIFGAMRLPAPNLARNANVMGPLVIMAWSLSEVIRYPFYALNAVLGGGTPPPYLIVWLRYTAFIILYPCGMLGEMTLLAISLPYVRSTGYWCWALAGGPKIPAHLPYVGGWNVVAFYYPYAVYVVLVAFPFGFWKLYSHMLKQRKKVIGGETGGATEKKQHRD